MESLGNTFGNNYVFVTSMSLLTRFENVNLLYNRF